MARSPSMESLSDPYLPTNDNVTLTLTVSNGTLGLSTSIAGGVTSDQVTNNGTAALTVTAPLGAINSTLADSTGLTYTRTNGSSGSDALALSASDPLGNSDSASVSITSGGPLVITTPSGTQTVATGGTLVVSGVSLADPPLPNSEDVTITLAVTDGTVAISTTVNGGVSSDQITDNGTASVTVAAPLAAINATFADSNGLTYAPATGFRGSDTLALSASDPLSNSDSASVSVVVGGLTPADVSGTQLWLDPSDLSTLKLRDVVGLSASGQGELSRPGIAKDPADFHNTDGAGDTQMSVTFWVYFNSIVPDAGILGDSTGFASGSWALIIPVAATICGSSNTIASPGPSRMSSTPRARPSSRASGTLSRSPLMVRKLRQTDCTCGSAASIPPTMASNSCHRRSARIPRKRISTPAARAIRFGSATPASTSTPTCA